MRTLKKDKTPPKQDYYDHMDETFGRIKNSLTEEQKKKGSLDGMTSIFVEEERLWIFTKHPEKKDMLVKKYLNRHINPVTTSKFDE